MPSRPTAPLVALRAVSRTYPREGGEVRALDGVDLAIAPGDFVAVSGPSGSGKSTLLHVLALLDRPTAGRYELGGADVSRLDERERARLRNRRVGLVFQSFQLVPHLTVADNVELPLVYRGALPAERMHAARAALERVGLLDRLDHLPDELSGGEQQRTAIARAIAAAPDLLLADEPTGNLDDSAADGVLALLREVHAAGTTVLVVTHDARVAERAERRCRMTGGRLSGGLPYPCGGVA